MVNEVSPLQLANVNMDTESSDAGRVMSDKALQETNANLPMEVIVLDRVTDFREVHPAKVYSLIRLSPGKKITVVRLSQETKARLPSEDTEPGITIDFSDLQLAKA